MIKPCKHYSKKINSLSLFDLEVLRTVKNDPIGLTTSIFEILIPKYVNLKKDVLISVYSYPSFYNRVYKSLDKMASLGIIEKVVEAGLNGWNHDAGANIIASWNMIHNFPWLK